MTREVITVAPETEVLSALLLLAENDIGGAPVIDPYGAVVGILTERDCLACCLEATYHSEYGGLVSEYMSAQVTCLAPDEGLVQAAERFVSLPYHRFPVVEGGVLVGVISRRDVIRALAEAWQ
jgi:CBS domain-containing protein